MSLTSEWLYDMIEAHEDVLPPGADQSQLQASSAFFSSDGTLLSGSIDAIDCVGPVFSDALPTPENNQ